MLECSRTTDSPGEEVTVLYQWVVYLHIASVFAFVGIHGVSAWTGWMIKRERDPARIAWLTSLSGSTVNAIYYALALVLATGVMLGFMGSWWGKRWIWAAIVVLVLLIVAMGFLSGDFRKVRVAAGVPDSGKKGPPGPPAAPEAIVAAAAGIQASLITAVGSIGLLLILWLMLFKPF
jgi:hypothetical protein